MQRLRRQHHSGVRRPALTAAYALSALILMAAVAGGVAEIRGYGPVVGAGRAWPSVPWPVSGFIAAWVAATLAIQVARIRKLG